MSCEDSDKPGLFALLVFVTTAFHAALRVLAHYNRHGQPATYVRWCKLGLVVAHVLLAINLFVIYTSVWDPLSRRNWEQRAFTVSKTTVFDWSVVVALTHSTNSLPVAWQQPCSASSNCTQLAEQFIAGRSVSLFVNPSCPWQMRDDISGSAAAFTVVSFISVFLIGLWVVLSVLQYRLSRTLPSPLVVAVVPPEYESPPSYHSHTQVDTTDVAIPGATTVFL